MRAEHVTLIKKAIRMVDYMRADLVRILEAEGTATTLLQPLEKMGDKPASGLYAAFDAATAAKNAQPVTNDEGKHVDDCPCWGCVALRKPELRSVKLTPGEVERVQAGELNPFNPHGVDIPFRDKALPDPAPIGGLQALLNAPPADPNGPRVIVHDIEEFAPPPPPPAPRPLTEYELRKAEIHAQRGTAFGGQVCIAAHAPAGTHCTCPRCKP
jgi:hypothetical protein